MAQSEGLLRRSSSLRPMRSHLDLRVGRGKGAPTWVPTQMGPKRRAGATRRSVAGEACVGVARARLGASRRLGERSSCCGEGAEAPLL